jgi:multiple sugar transport system permease protein
MTPHPNPLDSARLSSTLARSGGRRWTARISHRQQEVLWAYLMLAPTIIGLFIFILGPALASIALAFVNTNFITGFEWVGLDNFSELFSDTTFWISAENTVIYVVGHVVPTVLIGLGFAIALNQRIRGLPFFRTLFFLPVVTPIVSSSLVWAWAYETEFGVFNYFLRSVGLNPVSWLNDSSTALMSIIIWSIWAGVGYPIILLLAGLQGVPSEQVEASKLDGAGPWQTFRFVVFPAISPTVFFVVVLLVVGSFQVFTQTFVMTNGGPGYSTYTIVMYLYKSGWNAFRFGYASAVAVVLFLVLALVTYVQFRLQNRWVHYEHS